MLDYLRDIYLRKLDTEIESITARLTKGACEDYSAYKNLCGQHYALKLAREKFIESMKEMDRADMDEDD